MSSTAAVILVVAVVVVVVVLASSAEAEAYASRKDTMADYKRQLVEYQTKQRLGLDLPSQQQMFIPSIQAVNPTVKGVTIHNSNDVYKLSSLNAGMLTPGVARQLFPEAKCQGKTAFDKNMSIIRNSLELSPTQEQERMQLAAAQTNYIPPGGIPPNHLWYSRTTIDRLNQPGLNSNLNVGAGYSCF